MEILEIIVKKDYKIDLICEHNKYDDQTIQKEILKKRGHVIYHVLKRMTEIEIPRSSGRRRRYKRRYSLILMTRKVINTWEKARKDTVFMPSRAKYDHPVEELRVYKRKDGINLI